MIATAALAGLALAVVAAAAVIDVIRYEIPDAAPVAVLVLAAAFGIATPGFGWLSHGGAVLMMFGFGLFAFSRSWLGGGDVKLMTAVAAWTGLPALPLMFLATSLAGGALAVIYAAGRHIAGRIAPDGTAAATPRLPYAVAIATGTLWWAWASGGGPLATR